MEIDDRFSLVLITVADEVSDWLMVHKINPFTAFLTGSGDFFFPGYKVVYIEDKDIRLMFRLCFSDSIKELPIKISTAILPKQS